MNIAIPPIGSKILLVKDWTFSLLADTRNIRLWNLDEKQKRYENINRYDVQVRKEWFTQQPRYYYKTVATGNSRIGTRPTLGGTREVTEYEFDVYYQTNVGLKDPKIFTFPAGSTFRVTKYFLPDTIWSITGVTHPNLVRFSVLLSPITQITGARFVALLDEVQKMEMEIL